MIMLCITCNNSKKNYNTIKHIMQDFYFNHFGVKFYESI